MPPPLSRMPTAPYPQPLPRRISKREFGWAPPRAGLAPLPPICAGESQPRWPSSAVEKYCRSVKLFLPGSSKVVGQPGAPELGDQSPRCSGW